MLYPEVRSCLCNQRLDARHRLQRLYLVDVKRGYHSLGPTDREVVEIS